MHVVCKACSASYHIPDEILADGPKQFRCAGCAESWTLAPIPIVEAAVASARVGFRAASRPDLEARISMLTRLRGSARAVAPAVAALCVVGGAMGLVAERSAVVAAAPASAGLFAALGLPVNLRGLALEGVHATTSDQGDKKVLLVAGEIVNLRGQATPVAGLRIVLRGGDGRELYVWTARAPKDQLAAGERAAFRAKLAAPPEGVRDVLVKFGAPGDKALFTEASS